MLRLLLPLLLLLGCDPCEELCRSEASAYGRCLDTWGLEWADLGAADQEAFRLRCVDAAAAVSLLDEEAAAGERASCNTTWTQLRTASDCDDRWAALVEHGAD
jgi:hypothetical protein